MSKEPLGKFQRNKDGTYVGYINVDECPRDKYLRLVCDTGVTENLSPDLAFMKLIVDGEDYELPLQDDAYDPNIHRYQFLLLAVLTNLVATVVIAGVLIFKYII